MGKVHFFEEILSCAQARLNFVINFARKKILMAASDLTSYSTYVSNKKASQECCTSLCSRTSRDTHQLKKEIVFANFGMRLLWQWHTAPDAQDLILVEPSRIPIEGSSHFLAVQRLVHSLLPNVYILYGGCTLSTEELAIFLHLTRCLPPSTL